MGIVCAFPCLPFTISLGQKTKPKKNKDNKFNKDKKRPGFEGGSAGKKPAKK
jgi:hypothetical protein